MSIAAYTAPETTPNLPRPAGGHGEYPVKHNGAILHKFATKQWFYRPAAARSVAWSGRTSRSRKKSLHISMNKPHDNPRFIV